MVVFRFCPKFMGGGGGLRMTSLLFNECGSSGVEVVGTLKPYLLF